MTVKDLVRTTIAEWNDELWKEAGPIYREAFPHGAKPEAILRGMLERGIGVLHTGTLGGRVAAMAVTGWAGRGTGTALIVDYMAVKGTMRGQGVGGRFLRQLLDWAHGHHGAGAAVIEVEADDTPENRKRMQFWEKCGFQPTAYVHRYVWVPEPYRAMLLRLDASSTVAPDGEALFRLITSFHEKAYRRR